MSKDNGWFPGIGGKSERVPESIENGQSGMERRPAIEPKPAEVIKTPPAEKPPASN